LKFDVHRTSSSLTLAAVKNGKYEYHACVIEAKKNNNHCMYWKREKSPTCLKMSSNSNAIVLKRPQYGCLAFDLYFVMDLETAAGFRGSHYHGYHASGVV
jgi:hypothetical protein